MDENVEVRLVPARPAGPLRPVVDPETGLINPLDECRAVLSERLEAAFDDESGFCLYSLLTGLSWEGLNDFAATTGTLARFAAWRVPMPVIKTPGIKATNDHDRLW